MKASIVPLEAASKHSNGCMIWPLGKTSIRKRPPLVSSTIFANSSAAPCRVSFAGVHVVGIRHWTFGCAIALGASMSAVAAAAIIAALVFARNFRRSVVITRSRGGRWPHQGGYAAALRPCSLGPKASIFCLFVSADAGQHLCGLLLDHRALEEVRVPLATEAHGV